MIVVCKTDGMTVAPYIYQEGDIFLYTGLYMKELEDLDGKEFEKKQKEVFGSVMLRKPTASELYRGLKQGVFSIGDCSKNEKKKLIPYLRDKKKADMELDESLMKQVEPVLEEAEEEPKSSKVVTKKGGSKPKKK